MISRIAALIPETCAQALHLNPWNRRMRLILQIDNQAVSGMIRHMPAVFFATGHMVKHLLAVLALACLFSAPVSGAFLPAAGPADIPAAVEINPGAVRLGSTDLFITAIIELPAPLSPDAGKIDVSRVRLLIRENEIPAETENFSLGDRNGNGVPDLTVRFDSQAVQAHLFAGKEELIVQGVVAGSADVRFRGSDSIRVRSIGKKKRLTLLQTSDLHHHASGYGPFLDYTPLDTTDKDEVLGGFSRLAAVIDRVRKEQAAVSVPVVLVDSGDFLMGTAYDLTAYNPLALQFFQAVGYDAVTLGDHEFDWSPSGLNLLLANAREEGFMVPVLATNMFTDGERGTPDDGLQMLTADGAVVDKHIIRLPDGLNIGLIGLMGPDAGSRAKAASPVTFDYDPDFIQSVVDDLRNNENADLIIALSHGGIRPDGSGNDAYLAGSVTGIDIIASGHYHTTTHEAFVKGPANTLVFSPGEYGKWLSRLDITYDESLGRIVDYAFTLIPINDTLEGDPHIQALVENHHKSMNRLISRLGAGIESPVSSTDISLARAPLKETGIGNLIADAFRWAATHASSGSGRPCDVGIAANGTIRGDLFPGRLGIITLSDVYNILPLGLSPGTSRLPPGIPLISVYATAADIYAICETGLTIAPSLEPDYYLNFSGVRIDYDPSHASGLQGVKTVYLCPAQDPFCLSEGTPLDRSDKTRLYRVAVDLHTLQMIQTLHERLAPYGFPLTLRNASGEPVHPADYLNYCVDASPDPGLQEMKGWTALWKFLAAMFPAGGEGIPAGLYGRDGMALGRVRCMQ